MNGMRKLKVTLKLLVQIGLMKFVACLKLTYSDGWDLIKRL